MGSPVDGGIEGHVPGCAGWCGRLSVMFILDNHRYPVILLANELLLHGFWLVNDTGFKDVYEPLMISGY